MKVSSASGKKLSPAREEREDRHSVGEPRLWAHLGPALLLQRVLGTSKSGNALTRYSLPSKSAWSCRGGQSQGRRE